MKETTSNETLSVLIVSAYFPPANTPGVHRMLRFSRHLLADGWRVQVLTIDPGYFHRGAKLDEGMLQDVPEGVDVHKTKVFRGITKILELKNKILLRHRKTLVDSRLDGNSAAAGKHRPVNRGQRLKDNLISVFEFPDPDVGWLWYAVRAGANLLRKNSVDVILSTAPPYTPHLIAAALSRRLKIPWVADFRDPMRVPLAWCPEQGRIRMTLRKWFEERIVSTADAIVLNTERMKREFEDVYGTGVSGKLHCVPNGYDSTFFDKYAEIRLPQDGSLTITHAGSLYGARNPIPLLIALASAIEKQRMPRGSIRVNLIGTHGAEFSITQTVAKLNLESAVKLLPPVPYDECLRHMAASHVLLVIQPDTQIQVPAKMYEYMALHRPILALSPDGAVGDLMREGRLGILAPPHDVDAIEEALCTLYAQKDDLATIYCRDKAFFRRYEAQALTRRLERVLSSASAVRNQAVKPTAK